MKIPGQAKQVFKGEIFDVYQWEQEMFDGSKAIFEMIKRPGTTEIIAIKEGRIWYANEEQPGKEKYQCFFGGRLDEGESSETAAKRELQEEAGMESDDWELIFSNQPIGKMDWANYVFIARECKTVSEQHLDGGEKINITSCTFDEFIQKILNQEFKTFPQLTIMIMNYVYRDPIKLDEFKKKLGVA